MLLSQIIMMSTTIIEITKGRAPSIIFFLMPFRRSVPKKTGTPCLQTFTILSLTRQGILFITPRGATLCLQFQGEFITLQWLSTTNVTIVVM